MRPITVIAMMCLGLNLAVAQSTFGELTPSEKGFEAFAKDTTASAIYLYEYGYNYFDIRNKYIYLVTEYHAKVKILKKEGFDRANIEIPYYTNGDRYEKVLDVKAITHNGETKTFLHPKDVYDIDDGENWSHKAFTFPDVRVGSVLEYSYEVQSPFHFNLSGWDFQSDIPKVYTEYNARIPGNWVYNRSLIGELPLETNDAHVKNDCFYIVGYGVADCEILKYAMSDVPAFEEDESFMLSGRNYRSKLEFELSEYHNLKGFTEKFTKTWKDVDKEFKTDKDLGRQLRKKNFFEENVPNDLLETGDLLHRAKAIYAFTKNHFNWNEQYGIWRNNNVKRAFENKKGNAAEINIALINLLNAAGIKANMMLIGTRKRGLPKRSHPVMSDFNYIIAKVDIDGKSYLLDATQDNMPFGMLPFRCLNYYGRVMDFENKSYWFDIVPENKNKKLIRAQMELDLEKELAIGKFNATSMGYEGVSEWGSLKSNSEEEYLDELASEVSSDFYLTSHKVVEDRSNDKLLLQQFDFEIENVVQGETIFLNPNIIKFFPSNPFKVSERHYPIDFGYKRSYSFNLNIKIPEGYAVKSIPEHRAVALPDNLGHLQFQCQSNNKAISVLFTFKLNAAHFKSDNYPFLKTFFQQAVDAQTKSYIVLEKV